VKDESIIRAGLANANTPAVMSPLVQTYLRTRPSIRVH